MTAAATSQSVPEPVAAGSAEGSAPEHGQDGRLPLADVTVIDLSRLFPGSFTTLLLAGLGARVIKVEDTGSGDGIRDMMVFDGLPESAAHVMLNRGKESISVDLKSAQGQELIRALIAKSDVLVDSFRPGVLDRLGLDREAISAVNPRIVHVSISAFGQDSPLAAVPAHDLNSVGYAGLLELTRDSDGGLIMPRLQNADLSAGWQAALAVLAGLRVVGRDNVGYRADVAMNEAAASVLALQLATVAGTGQPPPSPDYLTGQLACYNLYRCGDGQWITVAGLEPKFFNRMCTLIGRTDLIAAHYDPARQGWLRDELAATFATEARSHWLDLLAGEDTCVGPALSLPDALASPSMVARGAVTDVAFSDGHTARAFRAIPWDQRADNGLRAPALGEQTAAVLAEVGVTHEQLQRLIDSGIVRGTS